MYPKQELRLQNVNNNLNYVHFLAINYGWAISDVTEDVRTEAINNTSD